MDHFLLVVYPIIGCSGLLLLRFVLERLVTHVLVHCNQSSFPVQVFIRTPWIVVRTKKPNNEKTPRQSNIRKGVFSIEKMGPPPGIRNFLFQFSFS